MANGPRLIIREFVHFGRLRVHGRSLPRHAVPKNHRLEPRFRVRSLVNALLQVLASTFLNTRRNHQNAAMMPAALEELAQIQL